MTTNLKQLQDKVEREYETLFTYTSVNIDGTQTRILGTPDGHLAKSSLLKIFISSKLKEAYNAGREEAIEELKLWRPYFYNDRITGQDKKELLKFINQKES